MSARNAQRQARMSDFDASTEDLQEFLLERIPLARAMQLQIHAWHGDRIELHAPLAANVNDKGCAFGGSLSSLMTLAPWALLELSLREAGLEADVFVANAEIRYLIPIFEDIHVLAQPESGQSRERFISVLRERGRARIGMLSTVGDQDKPACVQQARFVAKLRG